ncbi:MAG: DUF2336 domain-containing protein [Pseudomonadota bacterium]
MALDTAPTKRDGRSSARALVTRRMADIVCLPASRVAPAERWIVADVLEEMLREAEPDLRAKVALRLADQADAPVGLLRRLAVDAFMIAEPILERSQALTDFDMMEIARQGDVQHRIALAQRDPVSQTVAAALVALGDEPVLKALLRNKSSVLAQETMARLVREAAESPALAGSLVKRPELRPAQALSLFWDVDHEQRKTILQRFAVDRTILREAAQDVFAAAIAATQDDPKLMRALSFIDRRQRDRSAADRSAYGSLEGAIEVADREGLEGDLIEEVAALAGIQLSLLQRMKDDFGGEAFAVLCKATGLPRSCIDSLLRGAQRDHGDVIANARLIYDTLSVDKAQTVLRYWDWSWSRAKDRA